MKKHLPTILIALACIILTAIIMKRWENKQDVKADIAKDKAKIENNKGKQATNVKRIDSVSTDLKSKGEKSVTEKNQLIKKYNEKLKTATPRDSSYDAQWRTVFGTNPPN